MNMASMKRTAEDKRKDMGGPASVDAMAPDFPWGLVIHLGADELNKLGMKEMPEAGCCYMLMATVQVTKVQVTAAAGMKPSDDPDRSVDLQITDMMLGEMPEGEEDDS